MSEYWDKKVKEVVKISKEMGYEDLDKIPFDNVGAHTCPHCNQKTFSDPCGHCGLKRSFLP